MNKIKDIIEAADKLAHVCAETGGALDVCGGSDGHLVSLCSKSSQTLIDAAGRYWEAKGTDKDGMPQKSNEYPNVPEWLQRVVVEHQELCDRIWKLKGFLNTHAAPDDIGCAAEILLKKQLRAMNEYKEILYVRICLANAELSLMKDANPALQSK